MSPDISSKSNEPKPTILIVEDDPGVANLERRRLERAGFAAITAATAEEARRMLREYRVDLILLDYLLPNNVDGLDFYNEARAAGFDLPVILVTGSGNEATVIKALRAGVRDFVTKSDEYLDFLPEAVNRVLQQVRTEHQLAESEARLAAIISSAKDAIIITEAGQRIILFNVAAEQMFRCSAGQAIGQRLSGFIPKEYVVAAHDHGGEPEQDPGSLTHHVKTGTRGVRADGEEFPLEASVARVKVGGQKFHTIVVRDLTDKKKLEKQLFQAQRMEGIGVLAGGVAHDFNNLLTVICGYSELLLSKTHQDDPAHKLLHEIRKAGERAAGLTRQLLAFSRKQILAPVVLDVNALVSEMEKMLHRLIGEDIDLACVLEPNLGRLKADPTQVEQVLMNLVVNARDAMPTGGQLTIETHNVNLDEAYVQQHRDARPGVYVRLAVTDSGCGMDEATQARIFEPFFTTKEVGKGTGLGLATVYGIVKQSGGHIEVYSEVGRGTTFKIYLPRLQGAIPSGPLSPASFVVPRGTETILLAEDEEALRRLSKIVLESSGYTVLEAGNGEEALQICQQHPATIHLLVTDVVMPKMSGGQLADLARALHPNLKVLCLSGYTNDAIIRHGVLESGMPFLQKPFTPSVLNRKVREVLDG